MERNYGGVIWTNHALQRLRERGIKQGDAWVTWRRPDQSKSGKNGSWVYYRTFGDQRVEVVAKKNDKGKWLILSVWSKRLRHTRKPEKSILVKLWEKITLKKNKESKHNTS